MHKPKGMEPLLLFLLAAFGVSCIFFSNTGANALGMKKEYLTPNFYSDVLSGGLILSALIQAGIYMRGKGQTEKETDNTSKKEWMLVGFVMLCSVLYVFGMGTIGFYISTFLCLFAINMTFEGWKRTCLGKGLVFALGVCMIFFVAFRYLKVFLPKTILF